MIALLAEIAESNKIAAGFMIATFSSVAEIDKGRRLPRLAKLPQFPKLPR